MSIDASQLPDGSGSANPNTAAAPEATKISFHYQLTADVIFKGMTKGFRTLHGLNDSDVRLDRIEDGTMHITFESVSAAHYNGVDRPRNREDAFVDLRDIFSQANIIVQVDTLNDAGRVVGRTKYIKDEKALMLRFDNEETHGLSVEFEVTEYFGE